MSISMLLHHLNTFSSRIMAGECSNGTKAISLFLEDCILDHFYDTTSHKLCCSQEMIDEEKVDTYNVPFYAPSAREIEDEVHREGSFTIDYIQTHELSTSTGDPLKDARITSMAIRAIQESMISHHFGEAIIDTLFHVYGGLLSQLMLKEEIKSSHLLIVLRKTH